MVIPDIIIHRRDEEWIIRTNDRGIPELVISEMYKDLSAEKTVTEKIFTPGRQISPIPSKVTLENLYVKHLYHF